MLNHLRPDRLTLGSGTGHGHHVGRPLDAYSSMGCHLKWLGYLLYLVPLLLRYRCGRRIPNDGHEWYGKRRRVRRGLNEGEPAAPWTNGDERDLDARLGPVPQPGPVDPAPTRIPSRQRQPSLLRSRSSVDLLSQLRHYGRWHALVGLLSCLQDEGSQQATRCGQE